MAVPGSWNNRPGPFWDQVRASPRSPRAGQLRKAGVVYRLASGNPIATITLDNRMQARKASVSGMLERTDRELGLEGRA